MKEPPAGIEPAPRPYKGRVLAVDTTEAWWSRRDSNPRLPALMCGLYGEHPTTRSPPRVQSPSSCCGPTVETAGIEPAPRSVQARGAPRARPQNPLHTRKHGADCLTRRTSASMKACPAAREAATRCRPSWTRKPAAGMEQAYRRRLTALVEHRRNCSTLAALRLRRRRPLRRTL